MPWLFVWLVGYENVSFMKMGPYVTTMQQHKNEEKCSKNSSHPTKNFSQMLNLQKT